MFEAAGRLGDVPNPDAARAEVLLVWHPGGKRQWVIVDRAASLAASTDDRMAELDESTRQVVASQLQSLDQDQPATRVSMKIEGMQGGTPTSDWESIRKLLPLNGVMFDGRDQV